MEEGPACANGGDLRRRLNAFEHKLSALVGEFQVLAPMLLSRSKEQRIPPAFESLVNVSQAHRHQLGQAARHIYRSRRKRDVVMPPDLFGEPAWDILLDLFASVCEGRRISVSSACIASSVPSTTALRWIAILVDQGLIVRTDDQADRRRAFVELTSKGHSMMSDYLQNYLSI